MHQINLLKYSAKQQIHKNIMYIELVNNMILLTIAVTLLTVMFVSSEKYLSYRIQKVSQSNGASKESMQINEINQQIDKIELVQKDYVKWSRIISNFLSLVPEGNTIYNLRFDKNMGKIILAGRAATRDDFLKLKDNLENSDLVSDLQSPISNLLYQKNFDFKLEANLSL